VGPTVTQGGSNAGECVTCSPPALGEDEKDFHRKGARDETLKLGT